MDEKKKKLLWELPLLLFLMIGTVVAIRRGQDAPYMNNNGFVFGTEYHITYQSKADLHDSIRAALDRVNASLSPFNPSSVISRMNRNEEVIADSMFTRVFTLARRISQATDGAFDITVAPLVNAWGFGFANKDSITAEGIDSLLRFVGYEKVELTPEGRLVKQDPRTILDCSAIAKGYGCDEVARLLSREGIKNYLVEIGGEIVVSGVNPKKKPWGVGIKQPIDDQLNANSELNTVLAITDVAMATSGNYRNFEVRNGKKYAHTIDPKTGYPVQHSILSSTVLARDCATADAYATAFMVMGLDSARQVLETHPELQVYFIYADDEGNYRTYQSPAIEKLIRN